MRYTSFELVRVTEAAAIAGSAWIGTGNKEAADKAATDAMRERLNLVDFAGKIVIGEGKKDKSFGLYSGEYVGKRGEGMGEVVGEEGSELYEIAVDPIDGTRPTVTSGPEAISVIAVGEKGALFATDEYYMNKLAYGPEVAKKVELSLADPISKTIKLYSAVTGKETSSIVVCILDRPRHEKLIAELRKIGVRIKLIQDCDISGAIACCLPESGIDLLWGSGGAPEGVITACAMKCLKGGFQVQVVKPDLKSVDGKIYSIEDLVRGPCAFAATGVTNGSLLRGVRFTSQGPVTNSVFMRSESGTVRWLTTYHGDSVP